MTLEQARAILELPEKFNSSELKRAYRDGLLVWHPDRFEGNEDLKAKATFRTQQINQAYQVAKAAIENATIAATSTTPHAWASNYSPQEPEIKNNPRSSNSTKASDSVKPEATKRLGHYLIRAFLWVGLSISLVALIGEAAQPFAGICGIIGISYLVRIP